MSEVKGEQNLFEQLEKNYHCRHRQYRLGRFEGCVVYVGRWRPADAEADELFYDLCVDLEVSGRAQQRAGEISFSDAIDDLYALVESTPV